MKTRRGLRVKMANTKFIMTEDKEIGWLRDSKKKMIGENQRRIKHRSLWGWIYQFRRTSKSEAVIPPAMYVRELQMHQTKSLFSSQNYQAKISLTNQCKEEIFWWTRQLVQWNAKQIMTQNPYLVIKPMHLCSGGYIIAQHWCKGEGGGGGKWNAQERHHHIHAVKSSRNVFLISCQEQKQN